METPFSAYQGDEPYIFVCYAHDDAALVYPEITRLHEAGFHVWYDEGIAPGSEWSKELAEHIERCAVFLYFVTPRSVEREHCRREVNFALEQQCSILAVHLAETEVPSALKLSLSNRQAILRYELSATRYQEKLDTALAHAAVGRSANVEDEASTLRIGDWLVDTGSGKLANGETETHLQPQSMAVLIYLARHPEEVVSPDELLENVWQGRFTGNDSVYQHIGLIRKALGDNAKEPAYIETIPKRGLRLVAPVSLPPPKPVHEPDESVASPPESTPSTIGTSFRWLTGSAITVVIGLGLWIFNQAPEPKTAMFDRTVGVLPFKDLSPNGNLAWLAEAIPFELTGGINDLGGRAVPPTLLPAQTMAELPANIGYVLEGYVQEAEEGITVGVQLTGRIADQVWTGTFESTGERRLDVQRDLSVGILRFFAESLGSYGALAPDVPAAREAYIRSQRARSYADNADEGYWLHQALAQDPDWDEGYLHLALYHSRLVWRADGNEQLALAAVAIDEARRRGLGDHSLIPFAEGYMAYIRPDGDLNLAERRFRESLLKGNPAGFGWYVNMMVQAGLLEDLLPWLEGVSQSVSVDPATLNFIASLLALAGDLERAYQVALNVERVSAPDAYSIYMIPLVLLEPRTGRLPEARRRIKRMDELIAAGRSDVVTWAGMRHVIAFDVAMAAGDRESALSIAEADAARPKPVDWATTATMLLRLGDSRAGEYFRLAVPKSQRGFIVYTLLALPPHLREHPTFQVYLDALGHTKEWRLELCRRASTLPPETGITCDPAKYALK